MPSIFVSSIFSPVFPCLVFSCRVIMIVRHFYVLHFQSPRCAALWPPTRDPPRNSTSGRSATSRKRPIDVVLGRRGAFQGRQIDVGMRRRVRRRYTVVQKSPHDVVTIRRRIDVPRFEFDVYATLRILMSITYVVWSRRHIEIATCIRRRTATSPQRHNDVAHDFATSPRRLLESTEGKPHDVAGLTWSACDVVTSLYDVTVTHCEAEVHILITKKLKIVSHENYNCASLDQLDNVVTEHEDGIGPPYHHALGRSPLI